MPIEQISPALASIVSQDQPIGDLAAGFGNDKSLPKVPFGGRREGTFFLATSATTGG